MFTKQPTNSSSASSVRPAIAEPIGMSVPAPNRDNVTANAACNTMNTVTPSARATSTIRACNSDGISNTAVCP
ncbi:hypothetical protein GCM10023336_00830 [Streptomyces similanensis]|uniref:Uncharacterized protein n=1 Tax=Streptomyces similanensis TaxID=1274988 RepID=A0ABP9JT63_9ACTN